MDEESVLKDYCLPKSHHFFKKTPLLMLTTRCWTKTTSFHSKHEHPPKKRSRSESRRRLSLRWKLVLKKELNLLKELPLKDENCICTCFAADKLNIFSSRDFACQASAQTICVSSEWSSLVSFDPIFVEIFRFCKLTDLSRNYRPHYDVFLIPF